MKVWETRWYGIENLREVVQPKPKPGEGEIVVAIKAASPAQDGSYPGSRQSRPGKRA